MTWKPKHPGRWVGAIGGVFCVQLAAAQSVDDLYESGARVIQQAQAQQEEINAIVEVTEDRFEEYQALQREIENSRIYNNLLQARVDNQNRQLDALYTAIDEAGVIERQILPLMRRMINGLERFISLDVPFLLDDRYARVESLRALILRPDVTAATQFRRVLEAWLIEISGPTGYGSTGDVYIDEIMTPDGRMREVQLLRIGRIALFYITPDGSQVGAWDQNARQWVELDPSMAEQIRIGIATFEETEPPALFMAPVAPPEEN